MELDEQLTDALNELGNIGAAHAATTLSQMLMRPVEMAVPEVHIVDIADIYQYIGDDVSALAVFQIQGDLPDGGFLIVNIPRSAVIQLTNQMLGSTDTEREITEMDQSAVTEIGNIMVSAFLDATAELLGIIMLPSPPALAIDMAHAAFEAVVAQIAIDVNEVVIFNTELKVDAPSIHGNIILLPQPGLLKELIRLLEGLMAPS